MIKVFVQNLAKYNEGIIRGRWLTLPMDEYELYADMAEILGNDEEYFISDYEAPFNIDQYDSVYSWNSFLEYAKENHVDFNVLSILIEEFDGDTEQVEKIIAEGSFRVFYNVDDMTDVAREIVEDNYGFSELDEFYKRYFDFEQFGKDLNENNNFHFDSKNRLCVEIFD